MAQSKSQSQSQPPSPSRVQSQSRPQSQYRQQSFEIEPVADHLDKVARLDPDEKLILVMGMTGAGKTTFINEATGSSLQTSGAMTSCTADVALSDPVVVKGHRIRLVDTPGYDDTYMSDAEIFKRVAKFLARVYKEDKERIIGAIYLQNMSQVHDTASTARATDYFKGITGFAAAQNVLILTTHWRTPGADGFSKAERDERDRQEQAYELREGALSNFKFILEKGANIMKYERKTSANFSRSSSPPPLPKWHKSPAVQRAGDKPASQFQPAPATDVVTNPRDVLQAFVEKPSVALLIQQETIDQKLKLKQTAGGSTANADIKFRIKEAEQTLKQAEKSLKKYMRTSMDSVKSIPGSAASAVSATTVVATTITTTMAATVNATITATVNATMSAAAVVAGAGAVAVGGSRSMNKRKSMAESRNPSRNVTPTASPAASVTELAADDKESEKEVETEEMALERERKEREKREMERAVEEARHDVERHKRTREELSLRVEESPKKSTLGLSRLKDMLTYDSDH